MANERTYNRDQVNRILSETLKRQQQKQKQFDNGEGLSAEDLMHIADEVGLDRDALKETLLNFSENDIQSSGNFFLGSSRLNHIEIVSGEITDEIWDHIQVELRGAIGGLGVPKKTGHAYELEQVVEELGYKHLSLIPKNGNTRIEYTEEWPALKILVLIFSFMIAAGLTLVTLKELEFTKLVTLLFAPVGGLLGLGAGLSILKAYFKSKKSKLKRIVNIVSDKLTSYTTSTISIEEDNHSIKSDMDLNPPEKRKTRL